jgi:hypothetical protein
VKRLLRLLLLDVVILLVVLAALIFAVRTYDSFQQRGEKGSYKLPSPPIPDRINHVDRSGKSTFLLPTK